MAGLTILFFDDYPLSSENLLFVERMRHRLRKYTPHIEIIKTIPGVEESLQERSFDFAILDVMARFRSELSGQSGDEKGNDALAGILVLQRCREGLYGKKNQETPIFIRTARGESHVRRSANRLGASGFFSAGTQDDQLIKRLFSAAGVKKKVAS